MKPLMERSDVENLVCATDAGREGELIFRLVYNQARCKKTFEQLWMLIIAFVIFIIPHIGNWIIERIVMVRCLLGEFIRS